MRPRPDAAENLQPTQRGYRRQRCFNEAAARCRGKPQLGRQPQILFRRASMRPRPDAAENLQRMVTDGHAGIGASMRPRPDAAENPKSARKEAIQGLGFNEAAARCRGKPLRPPRFDLGKTVLQ